MRKLIWMLAALLALAPAAFAQTAREMTDRCAFSSVGKKTLGRMTDVLGVVLERLGLCGD